MKYWITLIATILLAFLGFMAGFAMYNHPADADFWTGVLVVWGILAFFWGFHLNDQLS